MALSIEKLDIGEKTHNPNINLSNLVRTMKSHTTYRIWKLHKKYLSKEFWRENTFLTDGYFICSICNVSEKQLRKHIENQGWIGEYINGRKWL